MLLLATLVASLSLAGPAHAEYPLVGVLTGGELRSSGTATLSTDEIASDFVNDPATPENCIGQMCDDRKDLDLHERAAIRWDTSWLVDGRYPGVPADPNASANATRWLSDLGTWSSHRKEDDYAFPDDQGEGGHDENPVTTTRGCDTRLVARMPQGAETPLLSTGGNADFFDASKGRAFYLNAYGSTVNAQLCGENDRQGFWAFLGLVPVEGDQIAWDLGTAPKEAFAWNRVGRIDRTTACDPKFTDGTPRDTETQCAERQDVRADNKLTCALCVTDIKYEQHDRAGAGWAEVGRDGTWDGNEVRITAVIENRATKTLTVPVLLRDAESKRNLEGPGLENPKTVTFPPGSTTTYQVVWNTDGFAWEKGKPLSERNIQLLTPYGGAQQRILVRPRPVVLVHGWNSDASGWSAYPGMLKARHPQARGFAVGDGQFPGTMNTSPFLGNDIEDNAAAIKTYVQGLREGLSADHVDFVVHSMGGLISRQYLHSSMPKAIDGRNAVRRLIMLGTPNMGSPCADLIRVAARGIPTQQLTTGYARYFNTKVTNTKGVPLSIAAGDVRLPTCSSDVYGDMVVEVPSAHWTIGDRITTTVMHTDMTDDAHLLDSFVLPRIGLDPDAAKKLVAAPRAAVARGASAPSGDGRARAAAASTKAPAQAVGAFDTKVAGSKKLVQSFGAGAKPGFAFLAPATVAAELVAPNGKVVAKQPAGTPAAQAPIRWLGAAKRGSGRYTLRLKGTGKVVAAAVAQGGRDALTVAVKRTKSGALKVTARVQGAAARKAAVTAKVTGKAKGQTLRLKPVKGKAGRYAATSRKLAAGTWTATVTAKKGKVRLLGAAETTS